MNIDLYDKIVEIVEVNIRCNFGKITRIIRNETGFSEEAIKSFFDIVSGKRLFTYITDRQVSAIYRKAIEENRTFSDVIDEFSEEDNFWNHETFYRGFRRLYGMSPKAAKESGLEAESPKTLSDILGTIQHSDYLDIKHALTELELKYAEAVEKNRAALNDYDELVRAYNTMNREHKSEVDDLQAKIDLLVKKDKDLNLIKLERARLKEEVDNLKEARKRDAKNQSKLYGPKIEKLNLRIKELEERLMEARKAGATKDSISEDQYKVFMRLERCRKMFDLSIERIIELNAESEGRGVSLETLCEIEAFKNYDPEYELADFFHPCYSDGFEVYEDEDEAFREHLINEGTLQENWDYYNGDDEVPSRYEDDEDDFILF